MTQRKRHDETIRWVDELLPAPYDVDDVTKPGGALLRRAMHGDGDRYRFDHALLREGFQQYDTKQDAWYYGVWVHTGRWQTVCYAEGDTSVVTCDSAEAMRAELVELATFHGDPPPFAITIDHDGGATRHYDKRPSGDDVTEEPGHASG